MHIFIIALIVFIGSLVQGSSGFGFSLVCMALMPFFVPLKTAVVIQVFLAFIMVTYMAISMYKLVEIKLIIPPAISAGLFSYLGINTLVSLDDTILKRIFGIVLIFLTIYFVFISEKIQIRGNILTGLGAGVISGFTGGLFGVGGPPMVAYFISVTENKMKYNANIQAFFMINTITVLTIHIIKGNYTSDMIPLLAVSMIGLLFGTIMGMYLFKKMKLKSTKYFICAVMFLSGFYMLINI